MKTALIIPARYASTRFPGKPLASIGGQSMLSRVYDVACKAAEGLENITIIVATEDQRIAIHCDEIGVPCAMTPEDCPSGSDRALAAIKTMAEEPDFIVNLQGDAPFTPPDVVRAVIQAWQDNTELEVVTPVVQLDWNGLDVLREHKKTTPFSGTTCVRDQNGKALWFSKNIIPAIRKEDTMRGTDDKSPVFQHMGIYGFRTDVLKSFVSLPQSPYEKLEGLEQLRLLENGITLQTVVVQTDLGMAQAGIDSPEDLQRAEKILEALR